MIRVLINELMRVYEEGVGWDYFYRLNTLGISTDDASYSSASIYTNPKKTGQFTCKNYSC